MTTLNDLMAFLTVVCLVTWPLNKNEAGDDLVMIQASLSLSLNWDHFLFLKGLGHAILGNVSIDQMVIELTEITK